MTLQEIKPLLVLKHTYLHTQGFITLNQELNSIISQGYQLIETSYALDGDGAYGGLIHYGTINRLGATFIFAIP